LRWTLDYCEIGCIPLAVESTSLISMCEMLAELPKLNDALPDPWRKRGPCFIRSVVQGTMLHQLRQLIL
jgi:hypothetical protein